MWVPAIGPTTNNVARKEGSQELASYTDVMVHLSQKYPF